MEQGSAGKTRVTVATGFTETCFQRPPPLPLRAAEQIGTQGGLVAKIAQAAAMAMQTGLWDHCPGQHPRAAVTAKANFPYPGELARCQVQALCLFRGGWGGRKTLPENLNVKAFLTFLLQGPGKRSLHR